DDNPPSRISRAAYLYALRTWRRLGGAGTAFDGEACGVLQLAADAVDAQAQQNAALLFADAPQFVQWLAARGVADRYGIESLHGGRLFAQGGWVTPSSFCAALLEACGPGLVRRFGQEVASVRHENGQWRLCDAR